MAGRSGRGTFAAVATSVDTCSVDHCGPASGLGTLAAVAAQTSVAWIPVVSGREGGREGRGGGYCRRRSLEFHGVDLWGLSGGRDSLAPTRWHRIMFVIAFPTMVGGFFFGCVLFFWWCEHVEAQLFIPRRRARHNWTRMF